MRAKALRGCLSTLGLLLLISPVDGLAQTLEIALNFQGTDGVFDIAPVPDTMGAVGTDDVVQMLNGSFAVYDKDSTLQTRITDGEFWTTALTQAGTPIDFSPGTAPLDPRIVYDRYSQRWYATAIAFIHESHSRHYIGVTTGTDPSPENWRGFVLDGDPTDERWVDFPTLGYNSNAVFISSTMVPDAGGPRQLSVIGIPKSDLTAATPNIDHAQVYRNLDLNNSTNSAGVSWQAAVDISNGSGPLPALFVHNSQTLRLTELTDDFFTGTAPGLGDFVDVDFRQLAPFAAQPGTTNILGHAGLDRFYSSVVYDSAGSGLLWAVRARKIGDRSGLEWYAIDVEAGSVRFSGVISDPDLDYFEPSIALNKYGQVVIGFNGSSATQPVAAYAVVGDTVLNPFTIIGPLYSVHVSDPILLKQSPGPYTVDPNGDGVSTWGDYSATATDPSSPLTFWTFQEWALTTNEWSTQITKLRFKPGGAGLTDEYFVPFDAVRPREGGFEYIALKNQQYGGPLDIQTDGIQLNGFDNFATFGPDPSSPGQTQRLTFTSLFDVILEVEGRAFVLTNLMADWEETLTLRQIDGSERIFDTELLALFLDLRRVDGLPFDAWIDLDPSTAAIGEVVINEFDPGLFHHLSYYDLRTRFHVDFDRDGVADQVFLASDMSRFLLHAQIPEPGTAAFLATSALLLARRRR